MLKSVVFEDKQYIPIKIDEVCVKYKGRIVSSKKFDEVTIDETTECMLEYLIKGERK